MEAQIVNLLISLAISGATVYGGTKYAIAHLEKSSDKLEGDINGIRCELKKCATHDSCKENKLACRAERSVSMTDVLAKIEALRNEVIEQNRRREDAKDENTKLYYDIANKLTRLEARLESVIEAR